MEIFVICSENVLRHCHRKRRLRRKRRKASPWGQRRKQGKRGHDFVVIEIENSRCPVSTVIPV